VLGWEVVEREQLLQVVGDLGRGLGELRPVSVLERLGRFAGVVLVLPSRKNFNWKMTVRPSRNLTRMSMPSSPPRPSSGSTVAWSPYSSSTSSCTFLSNSGCVSSCQGMACLRCWCFMSDCPCSRSPTPSVSLATEISVAARCTAEPADARSRCKQDVGAGRALTRHAPTTLELEFNKSRRRLRPGGSTRSSDCVLVGGVQHLARRALSGGRTHAHRSVRTHLTVSLDERTGMSGRLCSGSGQSQ